MLKVMKPSKSPYIILRSTIQMEPPSLIIFEIVEKKVHQTFALGSRSNVMAPNESPYMISYMSTIQTQSLSLVVFEIFEKKSPYDLCPWFKVKGHGTK